MEAPTPAPQEQAPSVAAAPSVRPSKPPGWIPGLVAFLGAAFAGLIVYAVLRGDFGAEFAAITAMPWGQVTLADLYLGFVLYALAVLAVERSWLARLGWALPVFVLGNVWAAAWVAIRWRTILTRLGLS